MILWRMRISPKATNTYSEYVIFLAFPLQQWLHERASKLCYTYTACIVQYGNNHWGVHKTRTMFRSTVRVSVYEGVGCSM